MGKHASSGYGRFARELSSFAFRLLVVAVAFFGAIWLLVTYVPDWLGSGTDDELAQTAAEQTSSTSSESTSSVLDATITSPTSEATTSTTSSVPEATTTTEPVERLPADIVVLVLNSTSRTGLAASATAMLADLDYQTLEPANSEPQLTDSQVLWASGFALEAYALAAQFPDAEVLQNPDGDPPADIVVILGTSYVP